MFQKKTVKGKLMNIYKNVEKIVNQINSYFYIMTATIKIFFVNAT